MQVPNLFEGLNRDDHQITSLHLFSNSLFELSITSILPGKNVDTLQGKATFNNLLKNNNIEIEEALLSFNEKKCQFIKLKIKNKIKLNNLLNNNNLFKFNDKLSEILLVDVDLLNIEIVIDSFKNIEMKGNVDLINLKNELKDELFEIFDESSFDFICPFTCQLPNSLLTIQSIEELQNNTTTTISSFTIKINGNSKTSLNIKQAILDINLQNQKSEIISNKKLNANATFHSFEIENISFSTKITNKGVSLEASGTILKWENAFDIKDLTFENITVTCVFGMEFSLAVQINIPNIEGIGNLLFAGIISKDFYGIYLEIKDKITLIGISNLLTKLFNKKISLGKSKKFGKEIYLENSVLSISNSSGVIGDINVKQGFYISSELSIYKLKKLKTNFLINFNKLNTTIELKESFNLFEKYNFIQIGKKSKFYLNWEFEKKKLNIGLDAKIIFFNEQQLELDTNIYFKTDLSSTGIEPQFILNCQLTVNDNNLLSKYFPKSLQNGINEIEKEVKFKSACIVFSNFNYFYETDEYKIVPFNISANTIVIGALLETPIFQFKKLKKALQWIDYNNSIIKKENSVETLFTFSIGNGESILKPAEVKFSIEFRNFKFPLGKSFSFVPEKFELNISTDPEVTFILGVEYDPTNLMNNITNQLQSIQSVKEEGENNMTTVTTTSTAPMIRKEVQQEPLLFELEGTVSVDDLELIGRMKGEWKQPFHLKWLTIGNCGLGISLNYAQLCTTGMPSGVQMEANVAFNETKQIGIYFGINEVVTENFVIFSISDIGVDDFLELFNKLFSLKLNIVEFIYFKKLGISVSGKNMLITEGFTTKDKEGKKIVKRRNIPMGVTLFSELTLNIPKLIKVEGIIASTVTMKGLEIYGKIAPFKLMDGIISISGYNLLSKENIILVKNKKIKETEETNLNILQGIYEADENGEVTLIQDNSVELHLLLSTVQLPIVKVNGMIEIADMIIFEGDVDVNPGKGECSFIAEIELTNDISLMISFQQNQSTFQLNGKINRIDKIYEMLKEIIQNLKELFKKEKDNNKMKEFLKEKQEVKQQEEQELIENTLKDKEKLNVTVKEISNTRKRYRHTLLSISEQIEKETYKTKNEIIVKEEQEEEFDFELQKQLKEILHKMKEKCEEVYDDYILQINQQLKEVKEIIREKANETNNILKNYNNSINDIALFIANKIVNDTDFIMSKGIEKIKKLLKEFIYFKINDIDFIWTNSGLHFEIKYLIGDKEKIFKTSNVKLAEFKKLLVEFATYLIEQEVLDEEEIIHEKKEEVMNRNNSSRSCGCFCFSKRR
ncbi:hypothetical protein ABK040_002081 [Willaertia magna]